MGGKHRVYSTFRVFCQVLHGARAKAASRSLHSPTWVRSSPDGISQDKRGWDTHVNFLVHEDTCLALNMSSLYTFTEDL
jgi:hypothetical protein